jgi:hypothetical protein
MRERGKKGFGSRPRRTRKGTGSFVVFGREGRVWATGDGRAALAAPGIASCVAYQPSATRLHSRARRLEGVHPGREAGTRERHGKGARSEGQERMASRSVMSWFTVGKGAIADGPPTPPGPWKRSKVGRRESRPELPHGGIALRERRHVNWVASAFRRWYAGTT